MTIPSSPRNPTAPIRAVLLWTDAQLSPALAPWLRVTFGVDAVPIRDPGLRNAEDAVLFAAARKAGAVIMSKDANFVTLQARLGPPPQILWLTCGNTSNAALRSILASAWPRVSLLIDSGEPLVEIHARAS